MTKRIFKSNLLVVLLVLVATISSMFFVLYNYFEEQISGVLMRELNYLSQGVENKGIEYLSSFQNNKERITWIGADGVVLFDNKFDVKSMDNHLTREEVKEALEKNYGKSTRFSKTIDQNTYYYAKKMNDGSVLRISTKEMSAFQVLVSLSQPIVFLLALGVILCVIVSIKTAELIAKHINTLDPQNPVESDEFDELAPLIVKMIKLNRSNRNQLSKLKRKHEEFKAITENMSEVFLVLDKESNIISYNTSALKLFNVQSIEENQSVYVLNRSREFTQGIEEALSGNHQILTFKLGGRYYQMISNAVMFENMVSGAIVIILDITEKHEIENLRREFSANVSHELKTPLTSIRGFAELMKDNMVKSEDVPGFSKRIYDDANRMISMVEDIIKISQLDEGVGFTERENVDIYALTETILKRFEHSLEKKNVSATLTGDSFNINGVRRVLDEMVNNLIDNGIKYNVQGGKLDIVLTNNSDKMSITVKDTGIGISNDNLYRVFERFFCVDKSRSKESGGTGLGLSIVKHGAIHHGARVDIQSELGVGTSISIIWDKYRGELITPN